VKIALLTLLVSALAGCSTVDTAHTHAAHSSSAHSLIGNEIGLDHVLLWSGSPAAAEKQLADLGFTLSPKAGSYGAGISNKLVWFKNWSFIEFLWLSDPDQTRVEAPKEYEFVTNNNGSNAFGVSIADADYTYAELNKAGLDPEKPGAEAWDPDGPEGPKEPVVNEWRFMFLKEGALPGNPFFVQYAKKASTPRAERHANGAVQISAVWVVVSDLTQAKAAYERAHFVNGSTFKISAGNAVALSAGQGEIILIQPDASSPLNAALTTRGDHVLGISVQVADLAATARFLEQQLGHAPSRTVGHFGPSLLLPAQDPLGLLIEFHE